jgi:hypothetical protein
MCWNCGGMMPDDTHGSPDNITTETLRKAGRAGEPKTIKKADSFNQIYQKKIRGTPADTQPIS